MHGINKYWYLYCNRSGTNRIQEERKRQIMTQGSCKTRKPCIAHMKVTQNIVTGKVKVEYCSTHNSHSIEIAHLPVPLNVKHKIAAKLQVEKVLDDVRDSLSNGTIGCEQLLSRLAILNIQQQLNLGSIIINLVVVGYLKYTKHSNDHVSTCTWVEEMKALSYNLVIIFKPQGEEQSENMNNLSK